MADQRQWNIQRDGPQRLGRNGKFHAGACDDPAAFSIRLPSGGWGLSHPQREELIVVSQGGSQLETFIRPGSVSLITISNARISAVKRTRLDAECQRLDKVAAVSVLTGSNPGRINPPRVT